MQEFEKLMEKKFNLKKTSVVNKFIGFQLRPENSSVILHCSSMIEELAKKFQLDKSAPRSLPLVHGVEFDVEGDEFLPDRTVYLSLIGSLVYISQLCRPDVTVYVHFLAKKN